MEPTRAKALSFCGWNTERPEHIHGLKVVVLGRECIKMKSYLLINPWIYDFAAYDFGIKPVGLLRIAEYLRQQSNNVYLIDCLDGCSKQKDGYGFSKIRKD
jgi:hypothetical protein